MGKVLLVEDDIHLRELFKKILESAGYDVLELGDGREVITTIRQEAPALLILDMNLPYVDGPAVIEQIKRETDLPSFKIMGLTASTAFVNSPIQDDVDVFMMKPVSLKDLTTMTNRLLPLDS